jgi:putative serine protease PepD
MTAGFDHTGFEHPGPERPDAPERTGSLPPVFQPPGQAPGPVIPTQVGPPGYPQSGVLSPPVSAPAHGGWAPAPPPVPTAPRRRPVLAVLVVLLILAAAAQGVLLNQLNGKLDKANRQLASTKAADDQRIDGLSTRIKALETQAASSLDSAAVASAVLPSVFRVDAGDFSGTAFAVGKAPAGGGTNLITNYHVVQSIYEQGTRTAALERDNQRFPVQITQVDKANDLAMLHSDQSFNRLTPAAAQVKSGVPIVVVGAPLGLAQSVTTGVVSAVRNDFPGEGGKTFIQFSAPINPGNSGGPVVNAQKQVVGVASAKANDAEGIGLAIPIKQACDSFAALC